LVSKVDPKSQFLLAATHLKAKLEFEEMRTHEVEILFNWIEEYKKKVNVDLPVLVVGDFNAVTYGTAVPLAKTGKATLEKTTYTVPFALEDAYDYWKLTKRWSTYKKRSVEILETIDYILYSPNSLQLTSLLEIPDIKMFPERLPAPNYPSDHLAIGAQFQFKKIPQNVPSSKQPK